MLLTRWYLCRPARMTVVYGGAPERGKKVASPGPNAGHARQIMRGNTSAIWKHIPHRPAGQWSGRHLVPGTHFDITALTYDDEAIPAELIAADFAALEAAPDDEVFDIRAALDLHAGEWERRGLALPVLDSALIDTNYGDLPKLTVPLRAAVRQIAKNMQLQQCLGRVFVPLGLDATFNLLPERARDAFADHLVEMGVEPNHLPTDSQTFGSIYRVLMDNPAGIWGFDKIDSGVWHLGRPEANLKDP